MSGTLVFKCRARREQPRISAAGFRSPRMASLHKHLNLFLIVLIILISQSPSSTSSSLQRGAEKRSLLSLKETPTGANATFQCSPSGPCVYCLYSEKNDDKYRCSETGYHIPLKCVEIKGDSKVQKDKKSEKGRSTMENTQAKTHSMQDGEEGSMSVSKRRLLDNSSTLKGESQAYITYRSCIPAVFEEKLSVLGFEVIMLGLLCVSGPFIYFRRKRTNAMLGVGPVRGQTNSRF